MPIIKLNSEYFRNLLSDNNVNPAVEEKWEESLNIQIDKNILQCIYALPLVLCQPITFLLTLCTFIIFEGHRSSIVCLQKVKRFVEVIS